MNTKLRPLLIAIAATLASTPAIAEELQPIIISADLRESTEQDIAASVDVKTQAELQDQGASHFDDILLKTPNVNFSGQSSRARHIQIRGIGERDEYTGAPNSSVGFAIDDIDFSGIGMTGNLFDTKQVEVLRGPQNTRYGQSAIGGLINIQTNDPTATRESMVEATIGQDNHKELGIMTSGPVSSKKDAAQYRIAVFKHNSDGFRTNDTLDRTDTNGRDELTLRGKLRFLPDSDTTVDVSVIHADLNNGYDVWAADNSFNTQSVNPGKDTQLSNAGSLKVVSKTNPNYVVTSKTSLANSDMDYGYPEAWSSTPSEFYLNSKHRRTMSQELRFTSTEQSRIFKNTTDWLGGLYAAHLEERNKTEDYGPKSRQFDNQKFAGFMQLDYKVSNKATISSGFRLEKDMANFENSDGANNTSEETLWGANLTYNYKYNQTHTAYTGITRGYKAGGFNADFADDSSRVKFNAETSYNYEIGLKSDYIKHKLQTQIVAFYMDRTNPQFDGYSVPTSSADPWLFYTENFDSAQNFGVEATFNWNPTSALNLYGSLGLINTNVSGAPDGGISIINNRDQSHAPRYQGNFGAKYRASNGVYAQSDVTLVDKFFFDNVHNAQSDAYTLVNARIGYETQDYEVYLWGKNLTDETYATRGFFFNLQNPSSTDISTYDEYVRLGDPRQFGVTARVYF